MPEGGHDPSCPRDAGTARASLSGRRRRQLVSPSAMPWQSDIVPLVSKVRKDALTVPPYVLRALALLEEGGFEAWCVGGFVRDSLMGRAVADVDIASSAPWEKAQAVFEAAGFKTIETGVKHGTLTVVMASEVLEVTTYRSDGAYSDRRHPDSVSFVSSIEEDLARRDFTINAMAYHPDRGLLDPYGGRGDIASKTIRAVGEPRRRFAEDALRILRAVRFSSQLGFAIEEATFEAMAAQKELLGYIAKERAFHELNAFVCGAAVHDALMGCIDVIGQVIPEALPMKGFDQKTPYHVFDVLEHTAFCMENTSPSPLVRWAAFFHDIGKPEAFFTDEAGVGHFYGHGKISTEIARRVMRRLKFPTALAHDVALLVEHHDAVFEASPRPVKRMLRKLEGRPDLFYALTDLKRGDAAAQAPRCHDRIRLAGELDKALDAILEAQEAFSLHDLAINGHDVIALGIPAGPGVGEALEAALEAVIDEKAPNEKAALTAYLKEAIVPRLAPSP